MNDTTLASDFDINKSSEVDKKEVFKVAAAIGNLGKLKKLEADVSVEEEKIGLFYTADNGHLPCMRYLLEILETNISDKLLGTIFGRAAARGHLVCASYLLERYGKRISAMDKGQALEWAVLNDNLASVHYF